jgi:Methyltransferase domain
MLDSILQTKSIQRRFCMKPQLMLKTLAVTIGLGAFALAGCAVQPTAEAPSPESSVEAPAAESSSIAPSPQTSPDALAQAVERDVPYVPTPEPVVQRMLELGEVGPDDVIYDLGSGDGRIVITAAEQYGARGVGIDIDPQRIQEANANAQAANVTDRVEFRQQDLLQSDFSEATVVTLYLLPEVNLRLRPQLLEQLQPGTRIVSHSFDMGDWEPEQVVEVDGRTIYVWTVPEEIPENLRQAPQG